MKMLPERTSPKEITKLIFRSLLVGLIIAIVIGFVFPIAWMPAFITVTFIVFLDGFVESSAWKERLIRTGIIVGLMVIMNLTAWPIVKARFAARFPMLAATLPRTQMGVDTWLARLADKPAAEAKAILFESIKAQEKEVLTKQVQAKIAAGDNEGAADLIRLHQEKLEKIKASLEPKPAPDSSSQGAIAKTSAKLSGLFGSKDDIFIVKKSYPFTASAGEIRGPFKSFAGYATDVWSTPDSGYIITTDSGREYHKGDKFPPIIGQFHIKFLKDSAVEFRPVKL